MRESRARAVASSGGLDTNKSAIVSVAQFIITLRIIVSTANKSPRDISFVLLSCEENRRIELCEAGFPKCKF